MADEPEKDDSIRGLLEAAMAGDTGGGGDNDKQHAETSESGGGKQPPRSSNEARGDIPDGRVRLEDAAGQRARDEAGRFAKAEEGKARETLSLKEKPEAQTGAAPALKAADTSVAAPPPAPDGKTTAEPIAPPLEWKGAGKVKWDRLPREVQTELRDTWQAMAAERAEVAPLKELFDVNREFLVNQAGSLPAAMTQLMQFARMSVDNPRGLIEHIARTTGTDLRALVSGQPSPGTQQNQPGPPADVAQLVQQALQPILGQFEQQRTQQVVSQIEAFRADPKHPYFNDVAPRIEGLLKAGAAKDLQDAYDQAIWADPAIRPQLMSAHAEEAKRTQAAEVAAARAAQRTSLNGSPLAGGASQAMNGESDGSIRGDLMAAYRSQQGAV